MVKNRNYIITDYGEILNGNHRNPDIIQIRLRVNAYLSET